MLEKLAARGHRVVATSGTRSYAEQATLYAQGRTAPGRVVTKAPAGYSAHNWGVALDFAWDLDAATTKLEPSWQERHLKILADTANEVAGLDEGFYWSTFKDGPHVQLDLKRLGVGWHDLLRVAPQGQLGAAWALLDQRGGSLLA